jgi:hypothetical protein
MAWFTPNPADPEPVTNQQPPANQQPVTNQEPVTNPKPTIYPEYLSGFLTALDTQDDYGKIRGIIINIRNALHAEKNMSRLSKVAFINDMEERLKQCIVNMNNKTREKLSSENHSIKQIDQDIAVTNTIIANSIKNIREEFNLMNIMINRVLGKNRYIENVVPQKKKTRKFHTRNKIADFVNKNAVTDRVPIVGVNGGSRKRRLKRNLTKRVRRGQKSSYKKRKQRRR